jgi:ribosomal-protein-alanine N-acetyltransferase
MTTPDDKPLPEKPFPEHLRMPPTPVLETERLVLRPLRQSDAPVIQRRFPQWAVVQHLHDEIPWPYPDNGAAVNMAQCLEKMARREQCYWALTLKGGDDGLIGRIDLWADDGVKRDQRGFWLDPEFWGRGLMTEAANAVTDFALIELGWPHLWLNNAEANIASHRVKEKQGAREIDRTPRGYVSGPGIKVTWLLTREAWIAHRAARPGGVTS